jgi:hypothetical protein
LVKLLAQPISMVVAPLSAAVSHYRATFDLLLKDQRIHHLAAIDGARQLMHFQFAAGYGASAIIAV